MPPVAASGAGLPVTEAGAAALFLALALAVPLLGLLARHLGQLLRLAGRTLAVLGSLALLKVVGGFVGLSLGVNFLNALTMAVLGLPGFGLLLLLDWTCKL